MPGAYPTSVTAANVNARPEPNSIFGGAGSDNLLVTVFPDNTSTQPFKWTESRHNEGDISRNWTAYNFQVIRDDTLQLGIDGNVTGNRVAPVRSSSAVIVGSQRNQREWI